MTNLRQALEHVGDAEWLDEHSPLTMTTVTGTMTRSTRIDQAPATGVKTIDERLAAVWEDWLSRPKTSLQALLWQAVNQLRRDKDIDVQVLLLLAYFQDPRPKQADLIKLLAVGQSTFYRQLNIAVESLEHVVVTLLQPSLQLESVQAKPLIGCEALLEQCNTALEQAGLVHVTGASGLGKTSIGATLFENWSLQQRPAFWYSIRPGMTDNAQHFIYALAIFLHQHGESSLWLHLLTRPEELGPAKAMAMIRKALEALQAAPPLFCFDDVDLLLPNELNDSEQHQQFRALLEDFASSPRSGAPMLFIGQRLLMAPERGHVFQAERFGAPQTRQMLAQAGISLNDDAIQNIVLYTRGNPLLLNLLIVLYQLGEPAILQPSVLSSTASLDWFVTRLQRHLTDKERQVLESVCVFNTPAPAGLWHKQARAIDRLSQLKLVERVGTGRLAMLPALRDAFYHLLNDDARAMLHLAAAQGCAELGAFTLAAHHFVQGKHPEMAIWVWQAHRNEEIRQGQAQTALGIFAPLQFAPLSDERDRRALALILSDLYHLAGNQEAGLVALNSTTWPARRASTARAHETRARLLAMRGDIEHALSEYRVSLDELSREATIKPVRLRVEMARQMLVRSRDAGQAQHEAMLAKHDVEVILGEIEEEAGHVDAACTRYLAALEAARNAGDPARLAKACEMLGILEARRLNVNSAKGYLMEAGEHYLSYGNLVCATGMTNSNIAFAHMMAGQHEQAVAPLQTAIAFYEGMQQPYHLALNQANLAEVMMNLNEIEQAERLAQRALAHEEAVVRPLCLYVLGEARRRQQKFEDAERFCKDAIDSASVNSDAWSAAYAWRVVGDVYRDWNKPADAVSAYTHARNLFAQFGMQEDASDLDTRISNLNADAGAAT